MLRRFQFRSSFIATLAAIAMAAPVCAHAGVNKVTTTIKTTLTGSFFLNTGDQSSSEWIDFSGDVHLVVQAVPPSPITPPSPIRVHANMAGVSGIGRTSGQHFVLNGSENFEADGDVPNTLDLQGDEIGSPQTPLGTTRFRITFTTPGVYPYICALHDDLGMKGTIIVLP